MYLVFTTNDFPWLTIIVVFPISAGSLMLFLPHKGNKVNKWYTICICILELLLTTYAFCYNFKMDDRTSPSKGSGWQRPLNKGKCRELSPPL
nr:unnamed protein product [Synechocystis sp. PCC 6803]